MFTYYLKLFIRQFRRNKLFSSINILGLSSGICTSLLIYLYVNHELSYDKFHENEIYRINQTFIWGDQNDQQFGSTGPGVTTAMESEIPEVKRITRLHPHGEYLVTLPQPNQQTAFNERHIIAADSNFFDVFSYHLKQGNSATVLKKPNSLVMTESTAKRYFQDEDPMGQLLTLERNGNKDSYQITGVMEDLPTNSHIQFDMLMSMNSIPRVKRQNWTWIWTMFVTFVEFEEGTDIKAVEKKMNQLPPKYAGATLQRIMGTTFEEYTSDGKKWELFLQPLADIHLNPNTINRINPEGAGNPKIVFALGGAAIFIILLSCINFMNLSTSQYMTRAKFTGIRKILGSTRRQLSQAFIAEAFIYCFISFIVGLIGVYYFLPFFNNIIGEQLSIELLSSWEIVSVAGGLLLIISLLAGSYPALFLSAFDPVQTLKGKLKSGKESKPIRNGLVVIQFASSIILITCTLVVFQQLRHTQTMDLGFTKENLVSINNLNWMDNPESFVNELKSLPSVREVSLCTSLPPSLWGGDQFQPVNAPIENVAINFTSADESYVDALGLRLIEGRGFDKDFNDTHHIVINQTAVKSIGWDPNESVIGKKIKYADIPEPFEIIGLVSDFNYWNQNAPVEPFALFHLNSPIYDSGNKYAALSFKTQDNQSLQEAMAEIQAKWETFVPNRPHEYIFVDEAFAATFQHESRFAKILTIFAALAIMIAGLGLFGIIIYTIEQRTKEIGIRKVVGAGVWHIAVLLSKDHTKLILASIVIGIPISIWLMQNWLADFRHRVEMSPMIFVATGLGVTILALLISTYHTLRAAQTNPVDVIKDE